MPVVYGKGPNGGGASTRSASSAAAAVGRRGTPKRAVDAAAAPRAVVNPLLAQGKGSSRSPLAPVNFVVDQLQRSAYGVGNLAAGRLGGAYRTIIPAGIATEAIRNRSLATREEDRLFVSDELRRRGIIGDNKKGIAAGLAVDIFTDPATYVTFGYGAGAKGALAASRASKRLEAAQAAARQRGGQIGLGERARISSDYELELAKLPKEFSVGLGIPFTRRGNITLGRSQKIGQGIGKVQDALRPDSRNGIASSFLSTGGVSRTRKNIYQDTRRYGEVIRSDLARNTAKLDRSIRKLEKDLGLSKGQGARAIALHLDDPDNIELPAGLEEASVEARRLLDDIDEAERLDGIVRGNVRNYIPHMIAGKKGLKTALEDGQVTLNPNALDNPFFVQHRTAPTLREFIEAGKREGFDVETNIATLIRRRGEASITARTKAAVDNAVAETYGAKKPLAQDRTAPREAVVDANVRLGHAERELNRLMRGKDAGPARRAVDKARQKVVAAKAALRSAHRSEDDAKVALAQKNLDIAEGESRDAIQDFAERKAPELRARAQALRDQQEVTSANLPKPKAGRYTEEIPTTEEQRVESYLKLVRSELEEVDETIHEGYRDIGRLWRKEWERIRSTKDKDGFEGGFGGRQTGNLDRSRGHDRTGAGLHVPGQNVGREGDQAEGFLHRKGAVNEASFAEAGVPSPWGDNLADVGQRVMDDMDDWLRRGDARWSPTEEMVRAVSDLDPRIAEARELRALADNINDALELRRGGFVPDSGVPEDDLLAAFNVIAETVENPTRTRNLRARRTAAARRSEKRMEQSGVKLPGRIPETYAEAKTARARAALDRYFSPKPIPPSGMAPSDAPIPFRGYEAEARLLEREANIGLQRTEFYGKQAVAGAKKDLDRTIAAADKKAKREAEVGLNAAKREQQRAVVSAAEIKGTFQGTPKQIKRATLIVEKRKAELKRIEAEAQAFEKEVLDYAKRPGRKVDQETYDEMLEGWAEMGTSNRYHDGTLLPPDVAADLARIHREITPTISSESGLKDILKYYAQLHSRWKALALLSPGFHIRNMIDDGLRAYWAGARNPHSFVAAGRILWQDGQTAKGKIAKGGSLRVGGKDVEYAEWLDEAEVGGVIRTGQIHADILSTPAGDLSDAAVTAGGASRWIPGTGPLVRFSGKVGSAREDIFRLGTYIELRKSGMSQMEAAERVRNYLFDYGEVGQFVAASRRYFMPFITFPWKAIGNTSRVIATRPGRLANIDKGFQALNAAAGDPDYSQLPDHLQSSPFLPNAIGNLIPGVGDSEALLNINSVTGFSSLNMLDPRPDAIARNASSLVNPILRTPVELGYGLGNDDAPGYSFYFQNQYPKTAKAPWLVSQAARIPGVDKAIDFEEEGRTDRFTKEKIDTYNPIIDAVLRTFPPFTQAASVTNSGETGTLGRVRYLGGVPISTFDRAKAEFYLRERENSGR